MTSLMTIEGLTTKQEKFVRKVIQGHIPKDAAQIAGYANPETVGARLLSDLKIREAIFEGLNQVFIGRALPKAIRAIMDLIESKETNDKVKLDASKYVVDRADKLQALNKLRDVNATNLEELSEDELSIFIRRTRRIVKSHDALVDMGIET